MSLREELLQQMERDALRMGTIQPTLSIGPRATAADIQKAIDSLAASQGATTGGGVVELDAVTYVITQSIRLKNHVTLRGRGVGTVLQAGTNLGAPIVQNDATHNRFVCVANLRIHGNKANQASPNDGISFNLADVANDEYADTYWAIQDVVITDCKGTGINVVGRGEGLADNVVVRDCDGNGFQLAAPDCSLRHVRVSGSGYRGFYITQSNNILVQCKAFYNGLIGGGNGHGFEIADGVNHTLLVGCEAQDNNFHGYFIQGDYTNLLACTADSNNAGHNGDAERQGNGIQLTGASYSQIVAGCRDRNVNTHRQRYALGMASGAEGTTADIKSSGNLTGHVQNGWHTNVDLRVNSYGGQQDVAYAAAITLDPTVGSFINVGTLTGNITVNAPSAANTWTGAQVALKFTQDPTGGRVVTFGAGIKVNWAPNTSPNKVNVIVLRYDGTDWIQVSSATNL